MIWNLLVFILILLLYLLLVRPFRYWTKRNVPEHDVFTLWVQWLKCFLQPAPEAYKDIYNSYSGLRYAGIYHKSAPSLLIRDPDLIKQITITDFDYFVDHYMQFSSNDVKFEEKNLFCLKGNSWRNMRNILSPSFTGLKIRIMFELICKCAEQFVDHFENQGPKLSVVEFKDIFSRFSNDVIASTSYGVNCDSFKYPNNEFYTIAKKATNFKTLKAVLLFAAPKLCKSIGLQLFDTKLWNFFKKLITDNIEIRKQENLYRPDMINLLMESRNKKFEQDCLTDDDIASQAFVFLFAGFESVPSVMSFLAYELAMNVDIQERLRCEIDDTLRECGGSITYEILITMKYLDMVVSESLRKWSPTIDTNRVCVKPYTIKPISPKENAVHLKVGDVVVVPIFAIHRDPRFYPQPEKFDPERFSELNKANFPSHVYFPFGSGPRMCIANRFAVMEIKIMFFFLLSKFKISVSAKTQIPIQLGQNNITLHTKEGVWLGIQPRLA